MGRVNAMQNSMWNFCLVNSKNLYQYLLQRKIPSKQNQRHRFTTGLYTKCIATTDYSKILLTIVVHKNIFKRKTCVVDTMHFALPEHKVHTSHCLRLCRQTSPDVVLQRSFQLESSRIIFITMKYSSIKQLDMLQLPFCSRWCFTG